MKKSLLLVLGCLISVSASAACQSGETIDLRKIHAKVMSHIGVKNQGDYGLCYAYAGAALVDFHRIKGGGKSAYEISPIESGLLSAIDAENESEEGGDICDVVNSLSKRGKACPSAAVGSEGRYKDIGSWFHREVVNQVFMPYILKEEVFKSVSVKNFKERQVLGSGQKRYLQRFDGFYQSLITELSRRGFHSSSIPSASDVFRFAQKAHAENKYYILSPSFTQSLISKSCSTNLISVPKLNCKTQEVARSQMISELDHQLDNFKRPVGISYCSRMLTDKNAAGIDYYNKPKSNCGPHASVVIGKRGDGYGKCQYLIRNSWGKSYKYPWETSEGDIWVSEGALMMNVFKLHTTE
ncbi:MAG: hypothetical protein ACOVP4_06160 [Bacteriovoracaceae bacterium]|jgi:hypothetical protein